MLKQKTKKINSMNIGCVPRGKVTDKYCDTVDVQQQQIACLNTMSLCLLK